MRLLTISDEVVPALHRLSVPTMLGKIDMILSCGDLPPSYLEFLVTVLQVPCYYVRGNHDWKGELQDDGSYLKDPGGCDNLDLRVVHERGLLIAGIEGSILYNEHGVQYSEWQMRRRLWKLAPRLLLSQRRYKRPLDVLITHSPPQGIHDGPGAHRGFAALHRFIRRFQPRYMIHGHVHLRYGYGDQSPVTFGRTVVINTCGYRVLTIDV
jgi:uncharacterized protein